LPVCAPARSDFRKSSDAFLAGFGLSFPVTFGSFGPPVMIVPSGLTPASARFAARSAFFCAMSDLCVCALSDNSPSRADEYVPSSCANARSRDPIESAVLRNP
jgi:hypothetical protein